ncbi:hypothetical protein PS662_01757 [Pseudomonas fluorescens]|uniref:Uncharacterized protein n=1 Tax=Pseudomonas fluorescens TaxID=294 RepID=A0A5E6RQ26_PSEFL|nr:hypothetical protein PS662_01757 [Pseudomonas fluorescens]
MARLMIFNAVAALDALKIPKSAGEAIHRVLSDTRVRFEDS